MGKKLESSFKNMVLVLFLVTLGSFCRRGSCELTHVRVD